MRGKGMLLVTEFLLDHNGGGPEAWTHSAFPGLSAHPVSCQSALRGPAQPAHAIQCVGLRGLAWHQAGETWGAVGMWVGQPELIPTFTLALPYPPGGI